MAQNSQTPRPITAHRELMLQTVEIETAADRTNWIKRVKEAYLSGAIDTSDKRWLFHTLRFNTKGMAL